MSTGAECYFIGKEEGWFYALQEWPYGAWERYDTFGPFKTPSAAVDHLSENHANPGGWSMDAKTPERQAQLDEWHEREQG